MLLYLNASTWIGPDGERLLEQVHQARAEGVPLVLAHETDPALLGTKFSTPYVCSHELPGCHEPRYPEPEASTPLRAATPQSRVTPSPSRHRSTRTMARNQHGTLGVE